MTNEVKDKLATQQQAVDLFKPKKTGLAAQRAKAAKLLTNLDPLKVTNRIAIIFDDSGSMSSQEIDPKTGGYTGVSALKNAITGVNNFIANCRPEETSIAICPLNKEATQLSCNYSLINIFVGGLSANGGTPLYTKILNILDLPITRGVIFSDGDPTDNTNFNYDLRDDVKTGIADRAINKAISLKIPLDTIYIGEKNAKGYKVLEDIALRTNGIFVHFSSSQTLSNQLKYLTPGLRQLLLNADNKAKIEQGQKI